MKSSPGFRSSGKTIIPSCSSVICNSLSEQIIPDDACPLILTVLILKFPGKIVPIVAKAIFCPASTFGAPQTT